jgi:hypothetical protein
MAKPKMKDTIEALERTLRYEQGGIHKLQTELAETKKRLNQIAAENESLMQDKKWLKQVIQSLLPGANNALTH